MMYHEQQQTAFLDLHCLRAPGCLQRPENGCAEMLTARGPGRLEVKQAKMHGFTVVHLRSLSKREHCTMHVAATETTK